MPFLVGAIVDIGLRICVLKFNRAPCQMVIIFEVGPFDRDELQPHVVAVSNRVLLQSGDDSLFSYIELTFLVPSTAQCKMFH